MWPCGWGMGCHRSIWHLCMSHACPNQSVGKLVLMRQKYDNIPIPRWTVLKLIQPSENGLMSLRWSVAFDIKWYPDGDVPSYLHLFLSWLLPFPPRISLPNKVVAHRLLFWFLHPDEPSIKQWALWVTLESRLSSLDSGGRLLSGLKTQETSLLVVTGVITLGLQWRHKY